jgi:hypothetical protein
MPKALQDYWTGPEIGRQPTGYDVVFYGSKELNFSPVTSKRIWSFTSIE